MRQQHKKEFKKSLKRYSDDCFTFWKCLWGYIQKLLVNFIVPADSKLKLKKVKREIITETLHENWKKTTENKSDGDT